MYFDLFLYVWHLPRCREDAEKAVQPRVAGERKITFYVFPGHDWMYCVADEVKGVETKWAAYGNTYSD